MAQIIADEFSCHFNFLRAVITSERFSRGEKKETYNSLLYNHQCWPNCGGFTCFWDLYPDGYFFSFDSSESIIVYCVYSPLNLCVYILLYLVFVCCAAPRPCSSV